MSGPSPVPAKSEDPAAQRRRILWSAWLLGLVALATYIGFIIATGLRG